MSELISFKDIEAVNKFKAQKRFARTCRFD